MHRGCYSSRQRADIVRAVATFSPPMVADLFTHSSLLPACCPSAIVRSLGTQQAGCWTRPVLLVWGGAPRRNRTGDPILTMDVLCRLS
jgi:hypothetical protein